MAAKSRSWYNGSNGKQAWLLSSLLSHSLYVRLSILRFQACTKVYHPSASSERVPLLSVVLCTFYLSRFPQAPKGIFLIHLDCANPREKLPSVARSGRKWLFYAPTPAKRKIISCQSKIPAGQQLHTLSKQTNNHGPAPALQDPRRADR